MKKKYRLKISYSRNIKTGRISHENSIDSGFREHSLQAGCQSADLAVSQYLNAQGCLHARPPM